MGKDKAAVAAGQQVRNERVRRWRRRADFADATGISLRIIAALENGERTNFAPETIEAVETTLRWAPGSYSRLLRGMRPQRDPDPELARIWDLWPDLPAEARRMLVAMAERALDR